MNPSDPHPRPMSVELNQKLRAIIESHSSPMQPEPTGVEPLLPELEGIRGVLFDIYGTLLISGTGDIGAHQEAAPETAFEDAVTACGIQTDLNGKAGTDEFVKQVELSHQRSKSQGIDYPEVEIVEIWRNVFRGSELGDETLMQFAVEYESRTNPIWPMPHAFETTRAIVKAGLLTGIISNSQFYTLIAMEALGQDNLETLGLGTCEQWQLSFATGYAKPSQFLYEQARQQLANDSIGPEQVLYVGNDMLKDIMPAAKVGFRTALFAGDSRSLRLREGDERVAGVQPDVVLTDLAQLNQCLRFG